VGCPGGGGSNTLCATTRPHTTGVHLSSFARTSTPPTAPARPHAARPAAAHPRTPAHAPCCLTATLQAARAEGRGRPRHQLWAVPVPLPRPAGAAARAGTLALMMGACQAQAVRRGSQAAGAGVAGTEPGHTTTLRRHHAGTHCALAPRALTAASRGWVASAGRWGLAAAFSPGLAPLWGRRAARAAQVQRRPRTHLASGPSSLLPTLVSHLPDFRLPFHSFMPPGCCWIACKLLPLLLARSHARSCHEWNCRRLFSALWTSAQAGRRVSHCNTLRPCNQPGELAGPGLTFRH